MELGREIQGSKQQSKLTRYFEKVVQGVPPSSWSRVLRNLLGSRILGPGPTSQVAKSLRKHSFHRQQLALSMRKASRLGRASVARRAALAQKIRQHRAGMAKAMTSGRAASLGGLAASRRGMALASVLSKLSITTAIVTEAFKGLAKVVTAGQGIIGQYWRFSAGGVRAMVIETMGDFRRNIKISQQISDDMTEFARSQQKMKDVFEPAYTAVYKGILRFGTKLMDLAGKFGQGIFQGAFGGAGLDDDLKKRIAAHEAKGQKFLFGLDAIDIQNAAKGIPLGDPAKEKMRQELVEEKKKLDEERKKAEEGDKDLERKAIDWWKGIPRFGLDPDRQAKIMAKKHLARVMGWQDRIATNRAMIAGAAGVMAGGLAGFARPGAFGAGGVGAPVPPGRGGDPQARQKFVEEQVLIWANKRQAFDDEMAAITSKNKKISKEDADKLEILLRKRSEMQRQYWKWKHELDKMQGIKIVRPDNNFVPRGARPRDVRPGDPRPRVPSALGPS